MNHGASKSAAKESYFAEIEEALSSVLSILNEEGGTTSNSGGTSELSKLLLSPGKYRHLLLFFPTLVPPHTSHVETVVTPI